MSQCSPWSAGNANVGLAVGTFSPVPLQAFSSWTPTSTVAGEGEAAAAALIVARMSAS
jgi:hypothetical protein